MSDLKTPLEVITSLNSDQVSEMNMAELAYYLGVAQSVVKILQDDNDKRKLDGELLISLTKVVREVAEKALEGDYVFIDQWAKGPFMMGLNHKDEPPKVAAPGVKCDGCGELLESVAFSVYNENGVLQMGLLHCNECNTN